MQTSTGKVLHLESAITANRRRTPLGVTEVQIVEFARKHSSKIQGAGNCAVEIFGSCWLEDVDKEEEHFEKFLQNVPGKVVIIYAEGIEPLANLYKRVDEAKKAGASAACAIVHSATGIIHS